MGVMLYNADISHIVWCNANEKYRFHYVKETHDLRPLGKGQRRQIKFTVDQMKGSKRRGSLLF